MIRHYGTKFDTHEMVPVAVSYGIDALGKRYRIEPEGYRSILTIYGNGHERELLAGYDIPESEFLPGGALDYYGSQENAISEGAMFFAYRGNYYDIHEFMPTPSWYPWEEFTGIQSDSFFSGLAIMIDNHYEYVKVFTYYS